MSNYQQQSQSQSAGGAPSADTLEQLSISLQQQLPKQTGTLLMDHQGTVLAVRDTAAPRCAALR